MSDELTKTATKDDHLKKDDELEILREEVKILKQKHAEELDEDISIDKVKELECVSLKQLQFEHENEIQKYEYRLRQTQQSHILQLNNIRNQHKSDNDMELIRDEIDKRIKETSQLKREINDLQQIIKRLNNKNDGLEIEIKQIQNENQQKDSVINQMRKMLKRKVAKSRRNSQNIKDDEEQTVLTKGGHIRTKSKTIENATVIMNKLKDGVSIIQIEKNSDLTMNVNSDYDDSDNDAEYDEEMALKDSQIQQLKEKINNLKANIDKIKQQSSEELRLSQEKIGSLQTKIEIEEENFLKKNQMLQFKLKKQENDNKKNEEKMENLIDLQRKHCREIKILNNKIENLTEKDIEKDETILNLEQNLEMVQEENVTLKRCKEDIDSYERELDEMDEHYQNMAHEMRIKHEETHNKFTKFVQGKENENKSLRKTVHQHTAKIDELQTIIRDSKESRELNKADYIRKDEMDQVVHTKLDELKEEMKMRHVLEINSIKSKNKEKYEKMENELKNDIDRLIDNNNQITNDLNETRNKVQETENNMRRQLEAAEISRIQLLQTFMKEMDRMRDEIKRLNEIRGNQTR